MSYWYTYPIDDSDNSSTEDELTETQFEKMHAKIQKQIDFEWDFFTELGDMYFLYNFDGRHPDVSYWKDAPRSENALSHLTEYVTQDTMDIIKSGLEGYRDSDIRASGTSSWGKDHLKVIFEYAQLWVDENEMGKNDYLNDICWVASKIIQFQEMDHTIRVHF